jgi:hypothetical protein
MPNWEHHTLNSQLSSMFDLTVPRQTPQKRLTDQTQKTTGANRFIWALPLPVRQRIAEGIAPVELGARYDGLLHP